jgi:hypothetical protein
MGRPHGGLASNRTIKDQEKAEAAKQRSKCVPKKRPRSTVMELFAA